MDLVKRSTAKARELRRLNFFITETFELAEKHCEDAIKRGKQPFTMAIKDSFAVKDVRKTCASKMLANYTPEYTSTCVQRLLDNAMGSTSTTGHFGHVLHSCYAKQKPPEPGSDFRVAGGSSGGCAVSVGAEVVEMALGTDTGGSVRYPAAINGIYGFKPSYGRLSRHGLVPLANSLDTPSIFTNSISNCRRFYVYMKGNDPMDSTSLPDDVDLKKEKRRNVRSVKDLVVGVPKYKRTNLLSADAHRVWEAAIAQFKADGATIREVHLPNMEHAIKCYTIIVCADVASNMARYDGIRYGHRTEMKSGITHLEHITTNRSEGFSQAVKRRIFAGNYFLLQENYKQFVEQAAKVRRLIQQDYHEAFNQVDCILAPVSRHSAPMFSEVAQRSREDQWLDDYYNLHVNLSGLPSIAIPYGHCSQGLPLGVQLVGPYLEDERLLDMAEMLKNRKL